MAECKAMLFGFKKAKDLNYSNLLLRKDSQALVNFVQGSTSVPSFLQYLVRDIILLYIKLVCLQCCFSPKDSN